MPYIPLHATAKASIEQREQDEAEKLALKEGEVIYANFKKKHETASHPLKPAMPEHLKHWHDAAFHHNPGATVTVTQAYEHHCEWAEKNGHQPAKWQDFSHHMAQSGIVKQHVAGRQRYVGVGLNSNPQFDESVKPESEQVDESTLKLLGAAVKGAVKATVGGVKLAHKAYQYHQNQKTKTYHTILYSPDGGNTFHYHSHHETAAGADKVHENLSNFDIEDHHIVHMHLNKEEINHAKKNGNDFITHYHAKLLNGNKAPEAKHIKSAEKLSEPPKTPAKVSGAKSFQSWHNTVSSNSSRLSSAINAANPSFHYNDYKVHAGKYDHKPLTEPEFNKHFAKSEIGKKSVALKPVNAKAVDAVKPHPVTPVPLHTSNPMQEIKKK